MVSAAKGYGFCSFTRSWKVFYDDKDRPNRYLLAKELIRHPDAEELEVSYLLPTPSLEQITQKL